MIESELIDAMACLWVENGGDAAGLDWCLQDIRDKINQMVQAKQSDTYCLPSDADDETD